jgi:hypothetical protein
MALRKHINPKAKNKNVRCSVVIDCRTPMGFQTMHNCILTRNITYVDFNGTLVLNICENFQDKNIIPDLIDICSAVGIHFETVDELSFEQANLRLTV